MSHDRGCYLCGNDMWEYKNCSRTGCPKIKPEPMANSIMAELIETCSSPNPKTIHYVKSWKYLFEATVAGKKKADFRDKTERDYKVGDDIVLQEYDHIKGEYTGRQKLFKITHIISNDTPCAMSSGALNKDTCVLSLEPVPYDNSIDKL